MAKLTSQQRDHFCNRIKGRFKDMLGPLEKVAASKKAEMVDEKFDEFVESLGLKSTLEKFAELEADLIGMQQTISNHMTNLNEQYNIKESGYGSNYEWSWSQYGSQTDQLKSRLLKMCRKECEIAFKSIPEGQEIEKLKSKEIEAIDYVMGYDQQVELLNGLSSLLEGSGVAMLSEYKEVK